MSSALTINPDTDPLYVPHEWIGQRVSIATRTAFATPQGIASIGGEGVLESIHQNTIVVRITSERTGLGPLGVASLRKDDLRSVTLLSSIEAAVRPLRS